MILQFDGSKMTNVNINTVFVDTKKGFLLLISNFQFQLYSALIFQFLHFVQDDKVHFTTVLKIPAKNISHYFSTRL